MKSGLMGEVMAEFFGMMVLILIGLGVVATVVLFGSGAPGELVNGGVTNINLAWGIAVTMGIYTAGRISGAHLNPAVTIALAIFRGFSWAKVLPYCLAQVVGAFAGAGLVFFNYKAQFLKFDPALEKTAGVFCTFPAFRDMPSVGFFDQVLGTALLLFLILAVTDERNNPPGVLAPVAVGLIVVAIGMAFGPLHGYAINPARDFGPRLWTVVAGFANNGLTDGSNVFWVPIVGPILGGILGAAAYDYGVRRFLPPS